MIIIYWKDLLLKSRIKEHALNAGAEVKFAKNLDDLAELLKSQGIKRLIADLSAGSSFAESFKGLLSANIEAIGVISHVDKVTEEAGYNSGFTKIIPKSVLVRDLHALLT